MAQGKFSAYPAIGSKDIEAPLKILGQIAPRQLAQRFHGIGWEA